MPIKVLTVFGTRPEAIKLAPVIGRLQTDPRFESRVCVTAQHRELLDSVMRSFRLSADYDLDVMQPGQTLFDVTGRTMLGLKDVFAAARPDVVLVQGDTTTTLVASLAAFYAQTSLAHVEAGLRTDDKTRPFPEEMNRRLTTQLADIHFAPTKAARENLLREGVHANRITLTGNTIIDALLAVVESQRAPSAAAKLLDQLQAKGADLAVDRRRVLITAHRRESFGHGLKQICSAIRDLALRHGDVDFICPVHPNPNVQNVVRTCLTGLPNVQLTQHLDYDEFVFVMKRSYFLLTDSGGVQEEAPALGKPVLLMRETTERPEGPRCGGVKLVGLSARNIIANANDLLSNPTTYRAMSTAKNPYGNGQASARIVQELAERFTRRAAA